MYSCIALLLFRIHVNHCLCSRNIFRFLISKYIAISTQRRRGRIMCKWLVATALRILSAHCPHHSARRSTYLRKKTPAFAQCVLCPYFLNSNILAVSESALFNFKFWFAFIQNRKRNFVGTVNISNDIAAITRKCISKKESTVLFRCTGNCFFRCYNGKLDES